ncbi:MAG: glycerol kinase GlpK [Deltaproteobacteria bacterium]|jgi:glycerol kinase|nr:glycerol kinase GlpK [Deltaproteobacteria bacterium]
MTQSYLLAIDQGTSGTTCLIMDLDLNIIAKGYTEFPSVYPQNGWMEQSSEDIWQSTLSSIEQALKKGQINPGDLAAIGITNQRETTILWDRKTLKPVAPAIVWQCRRTRDLCRDLKKRELEPVFHQKTGLLLDPYFSGTKIRWILDEYDLHQKARKGEIKFGTVDSFLLSRLTGGKEHATDFTNASRTLLFNLKTLQWDQELAEYLQVPTQVLPEIKSSNALFGKTRGVGVLPDGIPITGILGDQQAALFGQAAFLPGEAKCTYGTGAFIMMNTGYEFVLSDSGLLTTVAWDIDGNTEYCLEGSAFVAGAAVQWFRDNLGLISYSAEIEELAAKVEDSGGVFFVPALSGLGAPYWEPDARAVFWGMTRNTNKNHLARAVLDGIALQNFTLLKSMESAARREIKQLKVDGGAAANNLLLQFQADILQKTVYRPENLEVTAYGAAAIAAMGAGIINSRKQIKAKIKFDRNFEPGMDKERVLYYTDYWEKIVKKSYI